MIAMLQGEVIEKFKNSLIIDVGGVGYEVSVTVHEFGAIKAGDSVKLYIYEQIAEKAHDLYGFTSRDGEQLFNQLLSVNGVGPRMALAIMNLGNSGQIKSAIASGNIAFISGAPGVGKRLAERLAVDLKDKLGEESLIERATGKTGISGDEALQALMSLGYSQGEAMEALAHVEATETDERVRLALKELAS